MANCIWTSIIAYVKSEAKGKAYVDTGFAADLFGRVTNIFGWTDYHLHTEGGEEGWFQEVSYRTSLATAPTKSRLTPCCMNKGYTHDCRSMIVEKQAAGPPGQAVKLCKKLIIDHILYLAHFMVWPQMMEPVGDTGLDKSVESENVSIHATDEVVSTWVEEVPQDEILSTCNTAKTYTFPELMNRDILVAKYDAADFQKFAVKELDLPREYLKADCVPNVLPMETMVYGQYVLQLSVKVNAHKFTSGLFYLSVLPDPVMLHSQYSQALAAMQRKGIWVDLSQAPLGCLQVPFQYRRGLVRNSAATNESTGVAPGVYARAQLHCIIPADSGTNMDKHAKILVFARLVKADLAGMAMIYGLQASAQGPIRSFVQPFRDFASYVKSADAIVGDALDFINADKPPMLANYSSVVPKARTFFPNSKGVSEATMLRSNPSATAEVQPRISSDGINTLVDIARIWGVYRIMEWQTTQEVGTQLLRVPLEPAYFYDTVLEESVEQEPPICGATRLASLWTGTLEFDIMFAGTDFHSGSLTVSYEYGRSSAPLDKGHCQPYAYQYDLLDIGEKRHFTIEVPYVYDTPWRRVPTQGPFLSWFVEDLRTEQQATWGMRMATEGWLVIRVANQLKAADTVTKTLKAVIRVRAGKSFGLMGLVGSSGRLVGGLTNVTDVMANIRQQGKKKVSEESQLHPRAEYADGGEDDQKLWHPSVQYYVPRATTSVGERIIAAKESVMQSEEKYKEALSKAAEADKLRQTVEDRDKQMATLSNRLAACSKSEIAVVQQDSSKVEKELARVKLQLKATEAYIQQQQDTSVKVEGSKEVPADCIVDGEVLDQYGYKGMGWAPVGSPIWEQARKAGKLHYSTQWRKLPVAQAPNRDNFPLDIVNNGSSNPYKGIAVGEAISLLDILRRPVHLVRGDKIKACKTTGDIKTNYSSLAIPAMPPQWVYLSAHNGKCFYGMIANLHHPSLHILSMFRHWRGSMEYTFMFYGMTDPTIPIYIFHVPHTGQLIYGDPSQYVIGPDREFNKYYGELRGGPGDHGYCYSSGAPESLGYATEVVIPSINPTVTVAVPYYSQNVQSTLNSEDWSHLGPARDRTDGLSGTLVVASAQDVRYDLWWSAGVDFEVGTYIGTVRQEMLPLKMTPADNVNNFPSGAVFRSNLSVPSQVLGRGVEEYKFELLSGRISKPLAPVEIISGQMWSAVTALTSMASSAVSVVAVQPFYAASGACREISSSVVSMAGNLNRTSSKVDSLVTVLEQSVVSGAQNLEEVIDKVNKQVEANFPMVKNSYMLVSAALDIWLLKTHQDPSAIANVVVRWLMTAGLVSVSGVVRTSQAVMKYLVSASQPRSQWSLYRIKEAVVAIKTLILSLDCFSGWAIPNKLMTFLDSVLYQHRIMKIVWTGRLVAALVEFIRYLFSLIKRFAYWIRGCKDPEVRVYYMLSDKGKDFQKFVGRVQKFLTPETKRLLKLSPKLRMEFYATGEIVKVVEVVMARAPKELQNQALSQMLAAFKKLMREMSQTLLTAPVKYEPFMVQMFGETNIGKSYLAGKVVEHHMDIVKPEVFAKPIIYRTPGQEFWTDVDGAEIAVIVDESTHLNTEQDNRGVVADVFMMKSPAKSNPNQASEDRKDVCINPLLGIFLANIPEPDMNEVRDHEALKRRFDISVKVRGIPGAEKNETMSHLRFTIVKECGRNVQSPEMSYEEFVQDYKGRVEKYHEKEVANVNHRTKELLRTVAREEELEFILKDPWSVYYKHLYGVCKGDHRDVSQAMKHAAANWMAEMGISDEFDFVVSQGPGSDVVKMARTQRYDYLHYRYAQLQEILYEKGPEVWTVEHIPNGDDRMGTKVENLNKPKAPILTGNGINTIIAVPELEDIHEATPEGLWETPEGWAQMVCNQGCPVTESCEHLEALLKKWVGDNVAALERAHLLREMHKSKLILKQQRQRRVLCDKYNDMEARTLKARSDYAKRQAANRISTRCVQHELQQEVAAFSMATHFALKQVVENNEKTDEAFQARMVEAAPIYMAAKEIMREEVRFENLSSEVPTEAFEPKKPSPRMEKIKKLVRELKKDMNNRAAWNKVKDAIQGNEETKPSKVDESRYKRYLFNCKLPTDFVDQFDHESQARHKAGGSFGQLLANAGIWGILKCDYMLTMMAEDFGLTYGDCTWCKSECVPVLKFCKDEYCEGRDVCTECLRDKPERAQCPKCKEYFENPIEKGKVARWIFTMFAPLINLASIPPALFLQYMCGIWQAWEGPRERWAFAAMYLFTGITQTWWACLAFPLINATKVAYTWYKSPFMWIPKKGYHCGLVHHVKEGMRLIRRGGVYLCEKCYHPHARAQMKKEEPENDIGMFVRGCAANCLPTDPTVHNIKSTMNRPCAHLDLFTANVPDGDCDVERDGVKYHLIPDLSFREGNWVITALNGEIVVKNAACSKDCILLDEKILRHMLTAFVDFNADATIHHQMQYGDGLGVPIQLIPEAMRKKSFMSKVGQAISKFTAKFTNTDWWKWVKDVSLSWIGKLAAVSAAILFVLLGIYKLYQMVFGSTDQAEPDQEEVVDILVEEVIAASQMTNVSGGAALPRQKFVRGRRLGKPKAQMVGGENLVNIMGAVMNNQAVLVIQTRAGEEIPVVGLAVCGNFMILPKHYMHAIETAVPNGISIQFMNGTVTYTYSYSPKDFRTVDDNDLVLFKMPPNVYPKRDIRNHFKNEEWYENNAIARRGYVAVPPIGRHPCFMLQRLEISERVSSMNVMEADGRGTYTILDSVAYNFSLPGACGSVIYQDTPQKPIIGIHVAGSGSYIDGRGYGLILSREMIDDLVQAFDEVILHPDETPVLPVAQITTSMVDTNVDYLGGVEKDKRCVQPMKTHIVPSVIADRIDHDPERLPVPLGENDGIYKDLPLTPLTAGIVNMGSEVADIPTHEDDYIAAGLRVLIAPMRSSVVSPRVLTPEEAVRGMEAEYYDGIDMSTSSGWPYCVERSPGNKSPWIEWNKQTGAVKLDPVLEEDMKRKQALRKSGVVPITVFADIMKDERKKKKKIQEVGSTRIISMSPLDFTLVVRQYYLHFMAAFMSGRDGLMHAVGITPDGPEWTALHTRLMRKNEKYVWTFDYKNFGPGFSTRAARSAYAAMTKWTMDNVKVGKEDVLAMEVINRELYNSVHLYDAMLYRQACGSPSGAAVTVIINTMVHLYYVLWAYVKIADKQPLLKTHIGTKGLIPSFREVVEYVAYGDDGIAATQQQWLAYINAKTVADELATLNVVATDGGKAVDVTPYVPYGDATFLKRGFARHPVFTKHQLAPLPEAVIKETAMFIHSSADPIEMTSQVVGASLLNAYGRGPIFYDNWYRTLVRACAEAKVEIPALSWQDLDLMFFGAVRAQTYYELPTQGLWTTAVVSDCLVYDTIDIEAITKQIKHISGLVSEHSREKGPPPMRLTRSRKVSGPKLDCNPVAGIDKAKFKNML